MYKMFYGVPVIPIGTKWTLDENDQILIKELAVLRNIEANEDNCNQTGKFSSSISGQIYSHIEGLGGEFSLCRTHNISIKESLNPRSKTVATDTFAILQNGLTVNSKTRKRYPDMELLVSTRKKLSVVNLYALFVGKFPTYIFSGFFPNDILIKRNDIVDHGNGPAYRVKESELMNIEDCIYYMIDN